MRAQPKHDRRFTLELIGGLHTRVEGKGGQITRDQQKKTKKQMKQMKQAIWKKNNPK